VAGDFGVSGAEIFKKWKTEEGDQVHHQEIVRLVVLIKEIGAPQHLLFLTNRHE
jgi:hypothetical protein